SSGQQCLCSNTPPLVGIDSALVEHTSKRGRDRPKEGNASSLVLRVPGSSPGAPTIDPAVLFACIKTSQSSLIFGLKNLLARSHLRRSSFAIAVSPRAGSRAALLARETTTMRHRRKPIKAHTSHRQGEANTLATAPAISL